MLPRSGRATTSRKDVGDGRAPPDPALSVVPVIAPVKLRACISLPPKPDPAEPVLGGSGWANPTVMRPTLSFPLTCVPCLAPPAFVPLPASLPIPTLTACEALRFEP